MSRRVQAKGAEAGIPGREKVCAKAGGSKECGIFEGLKEGQSDTSTSS